VCEGGGGQSFNRETNILFLSLSLYYFLYTQKPLRKKKTNKKNKKHNLIIHQSLKLFPPPPLFAATTASTNIYQMILPVIFHRLYLHSSSVKQLNPPE
jgi:hypothetical protein